MWRERERARERKKERERGEGERLTIRWKVQWMEVKK